MSLAKLMTKRLSPVPAQPTTTSEKQIKPKPTTAKHWSPFSIILCWWKSQQIFINSVLSFTPCLRTNKKMVCFLFIPVGRHASWFIYHSSTLTHMIFINLTHRWTLNISIVGHWFKLGAGDVFCCSTALNINTWPKKGTNNNKKPITKR